MRRSIAGHWMILLAVGLATVFLSGGAALGQDRAEISTELSQSALRPGDEAVLAIVADIEPGFHAQSHQPLESYLIPYVVKLKDLPHGVEAGEPLYAEGDIEEYPALGKMSVYSGQAVTYVPIRMRSDAPAGEVKLAGTVDLQICDDQVCYQPQTLTFSLATRVVGRDVRVELNRPELFKDYESRRAAAGGGSDDAVATTLPTLPAQAGAGGAATGIGDGREWSAPFAFGAAFVAGLLFNIMPCVLPVLPIKAKGFYEVAHHRRGQAFGYGVVFSLGLISVFAVLAMIVLVLRVVSWGELFSNPYVIWTIVGVLVFLSLGMFGGYDTSLPTFIYNFQPRHDTIPGNFFWGALMAILATPCTAPLLPPLLLWATFQPAVIGVPAIVMVGVGMASPYLILSAFPELARGIPRSGPWAELFKQMLGFAMLAAAAYFGAGRLIHGPGFMWVVVAVVAVAALYLMARTVQISKNAAPVAISSVLAVAMLGGTLWWTARLTGMLRPQVLVASADGKSSASWTEFSESAFSAARAANKPVLVKFTANWCATCQVIEGNVYQEPQVWAELNDRDIATFKADLTDSSAEGWPLLRQLNPAGGIPLTAIYPAGSDQPIVLASIYSTETLLETLKQIPAIGSRTAMK